MLVMLDEPKNEKWGSEAAAPIFASIGREALRYLNVPPAQHRAGGPRAGRDRHRGAVHRHAPPRSASTARPSSR